MVCTQRALRIGPAAARFAQRPATPLGGTQTTGRVNPAGAAANETSPAIVAGPSTAGVRAGGGRARGSSLGAQGVPLVQTRRPGEGHGLSPTLARLRSVR